MTSLDRTKGLYRYYKNRILEDYENLSWQIGFAISTKLLDMVENNIEDLEKVEALLLYTNSVENELHYSAWFELHGTIENYKLELQTLQRNK